MIRVPGVVEDPQAPCSLGSFWRSAGPPVKKPSSGPPAPADLCWEYRSNPLGIDLPRPRLNWALASVGRAEIHSAYRVLVARSALALHMDRGDLWDSGKVCTAGMPMIIPMAMIFIVILPLLRLAT